MAIRQLRLRDDEILKKRCKEVKKFDDKLSILLDDMFETMEKAEGVGLAAPQVGIIKRAVVIEIEDEKIEMVNPEIIETSGTQNGNEGCLSFPGLFGEVERPNYVKAKAQDRTGKTFIIEGEGLLARAICHECDHLDGHVFTEKVTKYLEN